MSKKTRLITLFFCLTTMLMFTACRKSESNKSTNSSTSSITVSGSTSVGPLMEKEAEKFQEANSGMKVEINQLGSSAGIKDAINGTVQIGMSSRDLKDQEKAEGLTEVEIAYDGIAIITNKANNVKSLTMSQVKDIYTGKIKNWKELGGKDSEIVVVSREDGSGTRDAFQEIVGYTSEELTKNAQIGDGSGNIKSTVAGNENAIGFISFEYVDDKINAINIDKIVPKAENVKNKSYKISRPFLLIYKEENLKDNGNKLIDFILSEEGQKIVEENGLIRIK
ncbi:phosphate ABC transporter substrate-binding protein [Terrisporobacter mayombei]|uniref:Phosphate-binding protein n=1 Tax=Terrisporobacter mayombei TaxID=1541 RepID=A0ABY9Q811_9FIRM|nr:phosphate ABC transporter substrate-binding protein [Terrisporobacter mayombei]MCC3868675.1 phosphate ABC transporter substrate-binding protein [Terrisporobacter mayombei]WMT83200.1 Phosphate-binding protein PstS 1 [Terrisporobacter mayombei]